MTQLYDEGGLQAKMMAGVMAWRRIAESMRGMRGVLAPSLIHDLEVMAEGFDTLPIVWSYVEDLKRDLDKAKGNPDPPKQDAKTEQRIEAAKMELAVHIDKFFDELGKVLGAAVPGTRGGT